MERRAKGGVAVHPWSSEDDGETRSSSPGDLRGLQQIDGPLFDAVVCQVPNDHLVAKLPLRPRLLSISLRAAGQIDAKPLQDEALF